MKKPMKLIGLLAWLYFVYQAFALYLNVLVSAKYDAFSNDDFQSIKFTLLYGAVLSLYSVIVCLINLKKDNS